jgi:hypothetical protein
VILPASAAFALLTVALPIAADPVLLNSFVV